MAATWLFWARVQVMAWTVGALPWIGAALSRAHRHLPLSVITTLSLVTVGCGSSMRRGISIGTEYRQSLAVASVLTISWTPVALLPRLTMVVMNHFCVLRS